MSALNGWADPISCSFKRARLVPLSRHGLCFMLPRGLKRVPTRVTVRKAHGFALIDLIFVCGVIGILVSIAMPSLFTAKQAASASSAIGSMRALNSAELTYALTCGSGFYAPSL